jgi:hypothetical protein
MSGASNKHISHDVNGLVFVPQLVVWQMCNPAAFVIRVRTVIFPLIFRGIASKTVVPAEEFLLLTTFDSLPPAQRAIAQAARDSVVMSLTTIELVDCLDSVCILTIIVAKDFIPCGT